MVTGASIPGNLYELDSLDQVIGHEFQVSRLRNFAAAVKRGSNTMPLLIFGVPGVGKSAAAKLLAKENNWNIVELNSSDYRDTESINERLLAAATSKSLFGARNLILLDEIDELASGFDKGAAAAISNLVEKARNPIIFVANDMWDQSIAFLRGRTEPVEFKRLSADHVKRILASLSARLSLNASPEAIDMLAHRCNGDARSAINDLSAVLGSDDQEGIVEVIGLRDRKTDIFNALDRIFLTSTIPSSMRAMSSSDVDADMLMKWIDENIPKRYSSNGEMADAFMSLSTASMFASRASRSQYYTYWRYMSIMMSSGVALSKRQGASLSRGYSFPQVIKELSNTKGSRAREKAIAEKLQGSLHSSVRRIIRNEMRTLAQSIRQSARKADKKEIEEELTARFGLDEKEAEYLMSLG